MTIKTTKQTVEIDVPVYVANDGTEFAEERECQNYEYECLRAKQHEEKEKTDNALKAITITSVVPGGLGLWDTEIRVCKLNSADDFTTICDWCRLNHYDMDYLD